MGKAILIGALVDLLQNELKLITKGAITPGNDGLEAGVQVPEDTACLSIVRYGNAVLVLLGAKVPLFKDLFVATFGLHSLLQFAGGIVPGVIVGEQIEAILQLDVTLSVGLLVRLHVPPLIELVRTQGGRHQVGGQEEEDN